MATTTKRRVYIWRWHIYYYPGWRSWASTEFLHYYSSISSVTYKISIAGLVVKGLDCDRLLCGSSRLFHRPHDEQLDSFRSRQDRGAPSSIDAFHRRVCVVYSAPSSSIVASAGYFDEYTSSICSTYAFVGRGGEQSRGSQVWMNPSHNAFAKNTIQSQVYCKHAFE